MSDLDDVLKKWSARGKNETYGPVEFVHAPVPADEHQKPQTESVEAMFDEAVELARSMLVETAAKGADFMPMAMVYAPLNQGPHVLVALIPEGWNGPRAKREIGRGLSEFCAKHQAAAMVLVTDGWCLVTPKDLTKEQSEEWQRQAGRPSEHPDRQEALTINCIYPDATAVGVIMLYKRHPEGKLVSTDDGEKGIRMGERIEWGECNDQRKGLDGDKGKLEQNIVPAWRLGVAE
jgi:hypothetical protein